MGATLLAVYRFSGSPLGAGVLVFLGACLVALGSAMQLGAIVDRQELSAAWTLLMKAGAWVLVVAATGWAILRAPGHELLAGLLTVPPLIGLIGVLAGGNGRRPAFGFLLVALALSALLIPAALERFG